MCLYHSDAALGFRRPTPVSSKLTLGATAYEGRFSLGFCGSGMARGYGSGFGHPRAVLDVQPKPLLVELIAAPGTSSVARHDRGGPWDPYERGLR